MKVRDCEERRRNRRKYVLLGFFKHIKRMFRSGRHTDQHYQLKGEKRLGKGRVDREKKSVASL